MILNQYENYTSITAPIYRINSQNNNTNTFENIVIIENFDDNSKQAFLITYNPSSDYIQSVTTNSLPAYKGEIAIQNLDYNSVDISSRVTCITYTQAICRNNGCPAGPGCFDNRDGGEHIIYETSIVCFSVNDVPVFVDMNESGTGGGESSTIYGSSSGTNNLNNTIVTEPVVPENRTEQKLLQSFTTLEQSNWWLFVASDETKDDIINYLNQNTINNVVDPQAEQFVLELINEIISFPIPEGDDNGDEFNYEDYSNIQTQTQNLPNRNTFYSNFPKNGTNGMLAPQVFQLVGGSILNSHINDPENYGNACAIRVSRALNYSGNPIPVFYNNTGQQRTQKGADNLNYILDAASLLAYMKKTFPNSSPIHLVNKTPTEIKSALNGKWGIYIMIPKNRATFGASGHADFWSNTGCLSGCYFDKAKEVYFWELF